MIFSADAYGFAYTRGGAASRSVTHLAAFGRYKHLHIQCGLAFFLALEEREVSTPTGEAAPRRQ